MRKSCLTIIVIFLLVFALLIGGVVFALRPPYKMVAPRGTDAPIKAQAAFNEYIMERAGLALDQYSGEGDLLVSLDQSGLAQVLADVLAAQIQDLPGGLKYTGVFMHVNSDYVQIGGGFKFLILPIGASVRLQLIVEDGELRMALLSTHLGRISLPMDFVLRTADRFIGLPLASDALSVSVPVDMGEGMVGITLTALGLEAEQILVNLRLEDVIPEIPAEAVESSPKKHSRYA